MFSQHSKDNREGRRLRASGLQIGVCEYVDKHGLLNHCRITGPLGTDEVGMPAESVIFTLPVRPTSVMFHIPF